MTGRKAQSKWESQINRDVPKDNGIVRFVANISRTDNNPTVQRYIDSGRGEAAVNKLKVWSVFDLLFHEWVDSDFTKGFYTRRGCEKLVAKMNAQDKAKGHHYVPLQNGFIVVASGWSAVNGWYAHAPVTGSLEGAHESI